MRRRQLTRRSLAVLLVIGVWALWLVWRVTDIQVVQQSHLSALAQGEHVHTITVPAPRGAILDRYGHVLAMDKPAYTVIAVPRVIEEAAKQLHQPNLIAQEASLLAKALPFPASQIASALKGTIWYRLLDQYLSPAKAEGLLTETAQLPGITLVPTESRYYPNNTLAAQVLGFVNANGQGLSGIEYADNRLLSGKPGQWTVTTDVNGNPLPEWTASKSSPVAGKTLELTIDSAIQQKVQQVLAQDVKKFHAQNGTVIIMNPKTGAVLALANYPTFNPNVYYQANPKTFADWAVTDPVPPGSIFKPVTASAALMDGVVSPTTMFDTRGYKIVSGVRINDWVPNGWGWISFTRGLELSSNQVFMDVGLKLGTQRLYQMIKAYGLMHPPGIGLPGNGSGIFIPPSRVNAVDLATIAFGQGIAITPLQEISIISTVANGGALLKPRIRRAILSPSGQVIRRFHPVVEGHPITSFVAHELHVMMEREVGYGTGVNAQVRGYTWAGKTGTAQQVVQGHTSTSIYVSSYAGYGPMPHPRFAMLVMINHPHGSIYGAEVAAPVWGQIAHWLMQYWHIAPYVHNSLPNGVPQGNSIPAN